MASRKAALTKEEADTYLRENGWEIEREGKGSHFKMYNPKVLKLSRRHKFDMPDNYKFTNEQVVGTITMTANPASFTWERIVKQVEWCKARITEIEATREKTSKFHSIKRECNEAFKKIRLWEQETKQRLKAGLKPNSAPVAYHAINNLLKNRNAFIR